MNTISENGTALSRDGLVEFQCRRILAKTSSKEFTGPVEQIVRALGKDRWLAIQKGQELSSYDLYVISRALGLNTDVLYPPGQPSLEDVQALYALSATGDKEQRSAILSSIRSLRIQAEQNYGKVIGLFAAAAISATLATQWAADHSSDTQQIYEVASALEEETDQLVSQGRSLADTGQIRAAFTAFDAAISSSRIRLDTLQEAGGDWSDAAYDLAQAVFWHADLNYRQGDTEAAITGYQEYATLAQALYDLDPANPSYRAERAWGQHNLAVAYFERGELDAALTGFELAESQLTDLIGQAGITELDADMSRGFRAATLFALGRFAEADQIRADQLALYASQSAPDLRTQTRALYSATRRAQIALLTGETAQADIASRTALDQADHILTSNPGHVDATRHYVELQSLRATVALTEGRTLAAKLLIDRARDRLAHEIDGDRIAPWREVAALALTGGQVALANDAPAAAINEANYALSLISEAQASYVDTALLTARAYEIIGAAHALAGQTDRAGRAWQTGLIELDSGAGHSLELAVRARLQHRLGMEGEAFASRETLATTDFSHPLDRAYWDTVDAAASVQLSQNGDIDG